MKIINESVIYNKNNFKASMYDVRDISELKNGSFFGTVGSLGTIEIIRPQLNFDKEGNLTYSLYSDFSTNNEIKIGNDNLTIMENLPLIFQKIDNHYAKELLTGQIFSIANEEMESKLNTPLNIEQFQKGVATYSTNNIMMHCPGLELTSSHDLSSRGIYVINDNFKYLYARDTLTKKKKIASIITSISKQARTCFTEEFQKCINITQNIAESDNLIYDIENKQNNLIKTKKAKK